jgi:uncharacterized protein
VLRTEQGSCEPVAVTERIEALDLLRGLALCGILLINIQHFSMYSGVARNPTLYGDLQGANFWVYGLNFVLAFQKLLPIFSMLFGAGIVLASRRREAAGMATATLHQRRMLILLGIGLSHAYLIWYGDILVTYAVCGLCVYYLRHSPPRDLLGLGVAGLVIAQLLRTIVWVLPVLLDGGDTNGAGAFDQIITDDLATFRGSWLQQLRVRAGIAFEGQTAGLVFIQFWRVSGIMLIGMALCKLGVLTGERSRRFYALLVAIALFVAVPITAATLYLNVQTGWGNAIYRGLAYMSIYWFGVVISLGWEENKTVLA